MFCGQPRFAGFWRRTGASLLDSIIFSVLIGLLLGALQAGSWAWSVENVISNALIAGLTMWLWIRFLGTPGKLLLDCQVVDADSYRPLRPRQAVLRYLAYIVSLLPLGLGFLWIAWDKRKQGFHDKIANTVVLYDAGLEADDESQKSLPRLISELR